MASREESIQSALDKLNSGAYSSLRAASRVHKIPRSTFRARLVGSQSHTITHRNQQRLTIDREESLAKWILDEDSRAHPSSHARVREIASLILQANGDNAPLGKNWMTSFLQRQTNVHTVVGCLSRLKARIEGLSERVIRAGRRASGLCPYNPELVLQSTQDQARRAATPPPISPNNLSYEVPMTPKRSQDLYRSQKLLERDVNLGRSTRYLLVTAGKAISRGNTEIAQLRASNARLQARLDQHRINKPKKRIQINPNERFKDIEAIKLAVEQAEGNSAETVSNRRATTSVRIETDEAASNINSMCNQWLI
ncbi:hypothetical protein K3495_g148 [Podosphaera aphanis]|nr:hypothetical protein K3495_g148 [Podosphaera aphanis]